RRMAGRRRGVTSLRAARVLPSSPAMRPARGFDKYEGLGNDFVVIDAGDDRDISPADAAEICDRRFGIGADGVLAMLPPRVAGADARMRVINADGSTPEMCGNGVRCVALRFAL